MIDWSQKIEGATGNLQELYKELSRLCKERPELVPAIEEMVGAAELTWLRQAPRTPMPPPIPYTPPFIMPYFAETDSVEWHRLIFTDNTNPASGGGD